MALVADTVNYDLSEKESLTYIKARFGKEISTFAYYSRKRKIDSGSYANEWLNYFSKVGFVVKHKQIIKVIEQMQQDILKDYLSKIVNHLNRESMITDRVNKNEISKLRYEIRESAKLLQELYLGTPIISQLKAKLDHVQVFQSSK